MGIVVIVIVAGLRYIQVGRVIAGEGLLQNIRRLNGISIYARHLRAAVKSIVINLAHRTGDLDEIHIGAVLESTFANGLQFSWQHN